jgi:hypothetical protein
LLLFQLGYASNVGKYTKGSLFLLLVLRVHSLNSSPLD